MELNDDLFKTNEFASKYKEGRISTARVQRSMSRVIRFHQADISRTVKGAKAAGISVGWRMRSPPIPCRGPQQDCLSYAACPEFSSTTCSIESRPDR